MEEGYFVPACIKNMPLTFLVDTGSNVTILRRDLLDNWPQEHLPSLIPVNTQLVTATGECSPFYGKAEVEISLGNQKLKHQFLFADIKNDGILGIDFLSTNGCDVLLSKDHLLLNGERIACFRSNVDAEPTCCRIALAENIEIPPDCEIIVKGRPIDMFDKDGVGILEASEALATRYGLMVAKALVCPKMGSVPLRIMNILDKPCFLRKNTVTATYEPVETETFERVSSLSAEKSCTEDSTSHIEDLISRSSANLNEPQKKKMTTLLHEYKDQFSRSSHDLGSSGLAEHTIRTIPNCKPVYQRPYRIPLAKQEFARKEIDLMAEKGLIEPSCSPWSSPVVLVPKRDGTTRFCIDYRKLNEVTIPDKHPLPNPEDTLGALGGSKWFSTVDLKSGFHQILIKESDRPLTAFSIPGSGLWQFRVLPFGLVNSGSVFERLMERIFDRLTYKFLLIYLDDIIVYSKTFDAHIENLREVFQRLKEANLKLNPKKCNLFCKKVSFLGHQVSEEGISTDPEKIQTIKEWPQPRNVKEVRQFVGLASYYRKFIRSFATICKPLHKLTEKDQLFVWTPEAQTAFDTIKTLLTTAPVLSYVDPSGQGFVLDADASNVGIGSILHQLQDGEEKVIGYFSRCLTRAERKYCTTRKELLAVVASVKHFHHYLYGQEFVIRSDHGSLRWILNFRNTGEGQLARFLETLSAYSFQLQHRAGRLHLNADTMSRRPCYADNCQYCARYEVKYLPNLTTDFSSERNIHCTGTQFSNATGKVNSENGALSTLQYENISHIQPKVIGDSTAKESLMCERVRTAANNVSYEAKLCDDASVCFRQDNDPANYIGPLVNDDMLAGRKACTTSSFGQRVTSGVSDEITPRDVTDRAPSPVGNACNDMVDEKTHKIDFDYCRPYTCCCQMAHCDDWLDCFEDEPLFGCLFGNEEYKGVETDGISCDEVTSQNPACIRNFSPLLENGTLDCQNVGHAGMISTRGATHEDTVHHPCEIDLPCDNSLPNNHSSGILQNSPCGNTKNCCSICQKKIRECMDQYQGCSNMSTRAIDGTVSNSPEISKESLHIEQEKDSTIQHMLQWKKNGTKPEWATVAPYCKELKVYWHQWDTIEIKDGILCKKYIRADGTGADYLYIVPVSLRKEIFKHLHEYTTGGHLGRRKTYEKFKKRFYWCNMHQDVSYWCRICTTCGSRKLPPRKAKGPMRQYNVGCPMERIAIDLTGPYPISKKGHKYLMVVSDYFTKWVDAIPLKSQEATHIAERLVNRFSSIFGVPLQLHTDMATNFESKVFQEVCKILGIDKTRTTARRPQSDGMVERANRTIQNMIASYISDKQDDWDEHIPLLMLAYRSSVHETLGVSPAMMTFGRDLTLPIDLALGRPVRDERRCITDHAYQLEQKLLEVHEFARKQLSIASDSMKRRYDLKMNYKEYKVGDPVWYFKPRRRVGYNPKLQADWKGPMVIIECLNNVLYRIKSSPKAKPEIAHHDHIRPYISEDKPTWFVTED